ncbi:hypothetical protein MXB_5303 [Myxobolus squamalis]|nr:hypothetical protein MXB_5303 [Myxobolus squamalis]
MYFYHELVPPSSVDIVFVSSLFVKDIQNLLIIKGNILEIYESVRDRKGNENKLIIHEKLEFYSRILAIESFKMHDGLEMLILCFPEIKVSCVRYNAHDYKFSLEFIYDAELELKVYIKYEK